ncbi:MAG: AAA family ATPase [Sphaerochaeta sp.]|nr:AAA family ATPase [Sphaerochaeta sp.]
MSDAASITKIIDYLKTSFIHTDNIEVDYSVSKQIVMEATASLAIEANYGNIQFKMRLDETKVQIINKDQDTYVLTPEMKYHYATPIELTKKFPNAMTIIHYSCAWNKLYCFCLFVVDKKKIPYTWKPYLAEDYNCPPDRPPSSFDYLFETSPSIYMIHTDVGNNNKPETLWSADYTNIKRNKDDIVNQFERMYSKYELYSSISNVKSPEEVFALFSLGEDPYVNVKEHIQNYHYGHIDTDTKSKINDYFTELCNNSQGKPEEVNLNSFLYDFCTRSLTHEKIGFCVDKVYRTDKYQAVFPFRNHFKNTIMAVVKCYCPDIPCKFFVPVTAWITESSSGMPVLAATTCVPYPGKQPLFNLDLIATQEAKTVIITDSLDIASLNQKNSELPGLVFTSFLCHEDNYDQVDWSPLSDEDNKVERLLLLVTNHSGYSLEEAYDKAKQLADYLDTNVLSKREGIEIEFIQLEVRYDKAKYSQHFAGWVTQLEDTYTNDSMKSHLVDEESVMHLTSAEFGEMYTRSQTPPKRFWEEDDTEDDSSPSSEDQKVKEKKYPIPYLMRPLICRGKTTMIYGPKASGKSLLSQSIAMAVVNANAQRPTRIFPEQLWRVNKPTQSDLDKGYECRKVLYLNFELAEEMASRQKDFEHSLWGDKENICKPNMIIEDMRNPEYNNVDFSLPENHEKIYKLLDKAQSKGIKDQPVDLLVIDTYTGFVKMEKDDTSKCFTQFCNDLYARNKNISILVVHHANKSNAPRGSQIKLDAMYMALSIDLIDSAKGAFSSCSYKYPNRNNPDKVINFTGRLNEKHLWVVDSIEGYAKPDEKRMTKDVCKQYNFLHHSKSNQAIMLGVSENTLRNQLKSK